jgi:hypothetical protein
MGWGEHNKVDTSLIVTEPHVPRPTACAQGLDLQEGLSVPNVPEIAKGYSMMSQYNGIVTYSTLTLGSKTAAAKSVSNADSEKKRERYLTSRKLKN